jgi:hypothetical protein
MQVFSKSGTSLLGPLPISTIFAGFGGHCQTDDDGDAIVLYDHLADRWLISQFAAVFVGGPPFHQCIAISQTGDPTDAYYRYDFIMPGNKLNDYAKFGVWPDAYYMSDNQFDPSLNGVGVFAFERDKMLTGDPTASFIYFDLDSVDPFIFGMLPADLDGPPPPAGTPNYFAYFTSDEFGDAQDGLRIFEFPPTSATPASSTFTERSAACYRCISTRSMSGVFTVPQKYRRETRLSHCRPPDVSTAIPQLRHPRIFCPIHRQRGAGTAGIRYYELRAIRRAAACR